jgi:hypothetical protein
LQIVAIAKRSEIRGKRSAIARQEVRQLVIEGLAVPDE